MNLGIIGCGTIAATYLQATARLNGLFRVTALCDVCPERAEALLPGAAVCTAVEELAAREDVSCVVISTPPHTHAGIAACCLRSGKHVLLEKPAALSVAEIDSLFALADEMGVVFCVAFHAAFGKEIDWYLRHMGTSDPLLSAGNICRLECAFYDPYLSEGTVPQDRKGLGGSYIDSGVNALSVCSRLVETEDLALRSHTAAHTEDGTVYSSRTVYEGGQARLIIRTGWDRGINQKRTRLYFHGTDVSVLLDHTGQSVLRIAPDGKESLLYRQTDTERLVSQYIQVFRMFAKALETGPEPAHRKQVTDIHTLLLCADCRDTGKVASV